MLPQRFLQSFYGGVVYLGEGFDMYCNIIRH